jgi:guanylate cyclase
MIRTQWPKFVSFLYGVGAEPDDSEDIKLRKAIMVAAHLMGISFGMVYAAYYYSLGNMFGALSTIAWAIITGLNLVLFSRTRNFRRFRDVVLLTVLIVPLLQQLSEGGYTAGATVIFAILVAPFALIAADLRQATYWYMGLIIVLLSAGLLDPLARTLRSGSDTEVSSFFVVNFAVVSLFIFVIMRYFVSQRDKAMRLLAAEQEKSETLLLNILPRKIAAILKNESRLIADSFPNGSILFADLVGFTPLSSEMPATEMVQLLNGIYTHFDRLVEGYGVEKIRTIGDNYMVAAGVPTPRADHAQALANMGLDIAEYASTHRPLNGKTMQFRIGINSGPLIAGVVGQKKFQYDVWGDTVNTASRMQSHGVAGKIQVTRSTYELLKDEFLLEPRGSIDVKGKGHMETWFLIGRITEHLA